MFGLGAVELVVILVIVLLLFGAGRVSGVMQDLGKGVTAFKTGLNTQDDEKIEEKNGVPKAGVGMKSEGIEGKKAGAASDTPKKPKKASPKKGHKLN